MDSYISFNNEIIKLDNIDNNDIYDINIFVNKNFDYNISFNRCDKFNYIEKTPNYQLLLNNKLYRKKLDDIYINKIKTYFFNKDINFMIDNDYKFIMNKKSNNENIYYDKRMHIFYYNYLECDKNNKIYPYSIFNLDLEYPNISLNTINVLQQQLKIMNQYLYYMNIHFTLKNKKLKEEINELKEKIERKTYKNLCYLILISSISLIFITSIKFMNK